MKKEALQMLLGVLFLLGLGGLFFALSAGLALEQYRQLTTYRPVEVTVVSARAVPAPNRNFLANLLEEKYEVQVTYKYIVDGRPHSADEVTPGNKKPTGQKTWAKRVAAEYPPGRRCTAYYDPDCPERAFLLRDVDFNYYGILVGTWLLIFGVLIASRAIAGLRSPRLSVSEPDGWWEVARWGGPVRCYAGAVIAAGVWFGACGLIWGFLYLFADRPLERDWFSVAATAGLNTVAGLPLALILRGDREEYRVRRCLGEARVLVNQPQFVQGEEIAVRVEQPVRSDTVVEVFAITLLCDSLEGFLPEQTRVWYTERIKKLRRHEVREGECVVVEHTFLAPIHFSLDESLPRNPRKAPRRQWRIEIMTRLAGGAECKAAYPITVHPSPEP